MTAFVALGPVFPLAAEPRAADLVQSFGHAVAGETVKETRSGRVVRARIGDQVCYVKRYFYRGWSGPLRGAFRTPTLRCASKRPSFMHTGQLRSLEQVVAFFDRGGDPAGHYPGENELTPLSLNSDEQADLVAFLATLDGPGPAPEWLATP